MRRSPSGPRLSGSVRGGICEHKSSNHFTESSTFLPENPNASNTGIETHCLQISRLVSCFPSGVLLEVIAHLSLRMYRNMRGI